MREEAQIKIYSMNEILDRIKIDGKDEISSNREIGRRTNINYERIRRFRKNEACPTWDEARRIAQEASLPTGLVFLSVAHAKANCGADEHVWEQILDSCESRIMYIM